MGVILPGSTIGIIGGGQLGKMLAMSAKRMGYRVIILEPDAYCPAASVSDVCITKPYEDQEALRQLSALCDVITYEFENIDALALSSISGYLPQGVDVLAIAQNRQKEKDTLSRLGYPVVPYRVIHHADMLSSHRINPILLKTLQGGYDGKGQWFIREQDSYPNVPFPLLEEAYVNIDKEISVIVNRSTNQDIEAFMPIENEHFAQKLYISRAPATLDEALSTAAISMAKSLMIALNAYGTLAVEMFVLANQTLIINELAPRPHNSGHLTLDAFSVSQFDQHIKAICGLPLAKPKLHQSAAMFNLYGQHLNQAYEMMISDKESHFHFYGKKEARTDRKMGHITRLYKNNGLRDQDIDAMRKSLYKEINHE